MKLLRLIPLIVALVLSAFMAQNRTGVTSAASGKPAPTKSPYQLSSAFLKNAHVKDVAVGPKGIPNGQSHARYGINGIDSVPNFNQHYFDAGIDYNGNPNSEWYTNTIGNPPQLGGTTRLNAPIVPVTVQLLNPDGSVLYTDSPAPYVNPVVNSPIFQYTNYSSSSTPTQYTDAIQRAEFAGSAKPDWHTLLTPSVKTGRVLQLPYGSYYYILNADNTCCLAVLADYSTFSNLLFPSVSTDTTTPVGAAENAGDITTKDVSSFLFPNTFLYLNGDVNVCCVAGYHGLDLEPGDASNGNLPRLYLVNFVTWISPGLFNGGFQDVAGISHEMSEAFNDPLDAIDGIHDITPFWSSGGQCSDALETGDVIEGLPNAIYPITLNSTTYHVQNEALIPWFEGASPSSALGGAYSYPDTSVLTSPAVSQPFNCGQ